MHEIGTAKITWSCSMSRKQQRYRSVMKSCDCCLGSKFWGCDAGMISLYETQPVRLIRFLLFLLTRYTFIVFCPRRKNCLAT